MWIIRRGRWRWQGATPGWWIEKAHQSNRRMRKTACPVVWEGWRAQSRQPDPILVGAALPPDPEALMRSRYVAYVMDRTDYILSTWHPRTRPPKLDQDRAPVRWLGLTMRRVEAGTSEDREGIVEFVARYKVGGRAYRLHETSRFVKEDERWFYLEAVAPD